jgi:predicted amidophosphoribosyltransferase
LKDEDDMATPKLQCPVCAARFRGVRICPRCGADLTPLMTLAASAAGHREAARQALRAGEFTRAAELTAAAQSLQATPEGRRLELLAAWLLDARPANS